MNETLNILVVDDELGMRLGIERALSNYRAGFHDLDCDVDFKVFVATNGDEAILRLGQEPAIDLLLLDYKLPGKNGIEVLEEAGRLAFDGAAVMMTAYASLDIAVLATKKGASDFLAKPFTPAELRAAVRQAVRTLLVERQARKLAAEKRRVRFEFISVLSHELKAPIGAVEGYLRLILSGSVTDDETLKRVLNRSIARLDGMRKLIFDILDLTRIESGTKKRKFESVGLRSLCQECMELAQMVAAERQISLCLSPGDECTMEGDRGELEIVLNNLISNAVKYNKDGGRVTVSIGSKEDLVQVKVADTGIGMTDTEKERLFGEFVRMKNDQTRHIEGSGLGLSTVKKIVDLYGGHIEVTSKWGEGTTFLVTLPKGDRAEKG